MLNPYARGGNDNGPPLEKVAAKSPEFSPLGETKIRKLKVQLPQNQPFFLAAVIIGGNTKLKKK